MAGRASILSMASFRVAFTSVLAGLLNPMWLSLICTNWNASGGVGCHNSSELGMPPATDHTTPEPVHAIQRKNPRLLTPSLAEFVTENCFIRKPPSAMTLARGIYSARFVLFSGCRIFRCWGINSEDLSLDFCQEDRLSLNVQLCAYKLCERWTPAKNYRYLSRRWFRI